MHQRIDRSTVFSRLLSRAGKALGLNAEGKSSEPIRVEPPFSVDDDGLKLTPPKHEPLKTAFELKPVFCVDEQSFPEPKVLRDIERRSPKIMCAAALGRGHDMAAPHDEIRPPACLGCRVVNAPASSAWPGPQRCLP